MTMEALAETPQGQPSLPTISMSDDGRGIEIRNMDDLTRLARMVLKEGLAPSGFKTIAAVAIAIQTGLELGLPALASLRSICVVNGIPSIYGKAGTALVLGTGQLEDVQESLIGNPFDDDYTAECVLKRRGLASPIAGRFSVADAKRAGLWGKGNWTKYPKDQIMWRARSRAYAAGFSDVLQGTPFVEVARDAPPQPPREADFQVRTDTEPAGPPKDGDIREADGKRERFFEGGIGWVEQPATPEGEEEEGAPEPLEEENPFAGFDPDV